MEGPIKPFSPESAAEIQRLELALESAGVGTWELDYKNNSVKWCKRTKALFGFSGADIVPFDELTQLIDPEDREILKLELQKVNNSPLDHSVSVEIRCCTNNADTPRWLLCKGQMHLNTQNNTSRFLGIFVNISGDVQKRQRISENEHHHRRFKTMVEQAPMAIGLLNGPEMIIELGNDKIFEVWGKDRSVIGLSIMQALPELKDQYFWRLLRKVYDTGEPFFGNGLSAKLQRHGKLEDVYFDFVYTPLRNNEGLTTGIMILATEVTEQFRIRKELEASETKFRSLIEQAPIAVCLFTGKDMVIEVANQPIINMWGKDGSVIGKPLKIAVPELEGQPFLDILAGILETGESYGSESAPADLEVDGVISTYYFNFTYKPIFDGEGKIVGIINVAIDVTKQVSAQKALEESEAKLQSVIQSAPAAMGLFVGRDLVLEMPNQAFIDIVGKGPDIEGLPLREVMPELENQAFLQILDDVYTTDVMYQSFGTQVNIVQQGVMTHNYYNITYSPLFDTEGNVYAILDIAIDVTERMLAQKQLEESQMELIMLFEQSPVAIAIIDKNNLTFTMANEFYGNLVGRPSDEIVGKSLFEAMPELAGQGFDKLLNKVVETGIPFISNEQAVDLVREGVLQTIYVDLTYQPQREIDGNIKGIFVICTDVTQQVLTRQKIEEAESTLRGAVELAELGTWQVNLSTRILEFSERLREWFGIRKDEIIPVARGYEPVRKSDRPLIKAAILHAITPGTDGVCDAEFTIEAVNGENERILHAQGKTYFNKKGEAEKIYGTVQDVTEQRKTQTALKQQVQQRTEELEIANKELASSNEELASINEEYMAINDELARSNGLLARSNENLQQFAYIASHDLQEPLRKVQSFGDLLMKRYSAQLGDGSDYVRRMQVAATRMSVLIQDLLTFSRVSVKQDVTSPVSLNKVVNSAFNVLELTVQEAKPVVSIDELPVIIGDETQLEQLFQNLLSNALKFHHPGAVPHIEVRASILYANELPKHVKPPRYNPAYHRIDVIDNGIGFDVSNAARIFQVFQRLHGKQEYAGTGIGLAICEKVAANHGGAITADSNPGQGSIFSVYLPV